MLFETITVIHSKQFVKKQNMEIQLITLVNQQMEVWHTSINAS